jgi:hypothetical protein
MALILGFGGTGDPGSAAEAAILSRDCSVEVSEDAGSDVLRPP